MSRRDLPWLVLGLLMSFAIGVAVSSLIAPCPACDDPAPRFRTTVLYTEHDTIVTPGWDDMMAPLNGPRR